MATKKDSIVRAGQPSPAVATDNVLLAAWRGSYDGVPPFDEATPELFPHALQRAIDERRGEVLAIADDRSGPTFANTVEAYERAGQQLDRMLSLFGVMTDNMATPAYQALDKEWSPKLSAADDELLLNPLLFQRIKAVYDNRATAGLDAAQQRLVTRLYEGFVRRGANLDPQQKEHLSAFNAQLAEKFAAFNEKLLADESSHVSATAAEMEGVPQDIRKSAAAAAAERGLGGGHYAIVNTRSAVEPVLTFADDRSLRERVWRRFVSRGDNGDANDTKQLIAQIVKARADRARLLGFANHAEWRMQDTMAKTPAQAMNLMMRVWPAAVARVEQEVADQQALADGLGHGIRIEPWDYLYYQEKVRKERYDLSQEEVKPYFELNNIIAASYWAAGELYGLDFEEVTGTVPVWHPDIRVYSVTDRRDATQIGLLYRDDYARSGKRSGAWMTSYRTRTVLLDERVVLVANNSNFIKAAAGEPVLISLDDATTLFHEFGHAIHYLLEDVRYPSFVNTPRDFVEYPSQLNENWLLTAPVLSRFAKHHRTGAPIPQALIDKIAMARTFNQGFETVEYLSAAIVDMMLHTDADGVIDPAVFEREALQKIGMPKEMMMRHRLPQFSHLFSSDSYSAGYYSYLWSETMDADTWAAFGEAGDPFHQPTADRFRRIILSTGNETDRAEAYRTFRGRDPDVNALLRKRGFPTR